MARGVIHTYNNKVEDIRARLAVINRIIYSRLNGWVYAKIIYKRAEGVEATDQGWIHMDGQLIYFIPGPYDISSVKLEDITVVILPIHYVYEITILRFPFMPGNVKGPGGDQ